MMPNYDRAEYLFAIFFTILIIIGAIAVPVSLYVVFNWLYF